MAAETSIALLLVLLNHLLDDPVCLPIISAGKGRLHRTAVVDDDEAVPLDPL